MHPHLNFFWVLQIDGACNYENGNRPTGNSGIIYGALQILELD